jgi:xylan 1,4-beta-xylosidase
MPTIHNPVLPGFHPDPCICRAGEDYYIANSTFEWFPGVAIYHSRDLVNWRLAARPLDSVGQLDLAGNIDSGGVWAPCLTWSDGLFWLIYTDVKSTHRYAKDTPNYLVIAPRIAGPWSVRVFLNASGFDPSLFHDDDGRKWLVNMVWDGRKGRNRFGGILLQEYSPERKALVGPVTNIFRGTDLGTTEGSHLYKRDGWYYLMTAEGGTGWRHAVTVARSRKLAGPYEVDPANPMLTSHGKDHLTLQKAGHASLVETPAGQWYLAHLCSRPIGEHRRCMLGRETAIQEVAWSADGWPRLAAGGNDPRVDVPAPDLPAWTPPRGFPARHDFDEPTLDGCFLSLRVRVDESWLSLTRRPGFCRLVGRQSLVSTHTQSLVARRVDAFRCRAGTCLEFNPRTHQQMAGLVAYYNTRNWMYLHLSRDETLGRCLRLSVMDNGEYDEPGGRDIATGDGAIALACEIDHDRLQFYWRAGGLSAGRLDGWLPVGPVLDAGKLSDDYCADPAFTGAFVGLCCQDLSGLALHADFDWFEYHRLD